MSQLWALAIGLLVALTPLVTLAGLLNLRDRREAGLRGLVCRRVPSRILRSDLGLRIRSSVFSTRSVVDLYPGGWAAAEVRDAIIRLRRALPDFVRLRVNGPLDPDWRGRLTIEPLRYRGASERGDQPRAVVPELGSGGSCARRM